LYTILDNGRRPLYCSIALKKSLGFFGNDKKQIPIQTRDAGHLPLGAIFNDKLQKGLKDDGFHLSSLFLYKV